MVNYINVYYNSFVKTMAFIQRLLFLQYPILFQIIQRKKNKYLKRNKGNMRDKGWRSSPGIQINRRDVLECCWKNQSGPGIPVRPSTSAEKNSRWSLPEYSLFVHPLSIVSIHVMNKTSHRHANLLRIVFIKYFYFWKNKIKKKFSYLL